MLLIALQLESFYKKVAKDDRLTPLKKIETVFLF